MHHVLIPIKVRQRRQVASNSRLHGLHPLLGEAVLLGHDAVLDTSQGQYQRHRDARAVLPGRAMDETRLVRVIAQVREDSLESIRAMG